MNPVSGKLESLLADGENDGGGLGLQDAAAGKTLFALTALQRTSSLRESSRVQIDDNVDHGGEPVSSAG